MLHICLEEISFLLVGAKEELNTKDKQDSLFFPFLNKFKQIKKKRKGKTRKMNCKLIVSLFVLFAQKKLKEKNHGDTKRNQKHRTAGIR